MGNVGLTWRRISRNEEAARGGSRGAHPTNTGDRGRSRSAAEEDSDAETLSISAGHRPRCRRGSAVRALRHARQGQAETAALSVRTDHRSMRARGVRLRLRLRLSVPVSLIATRETPKSRWSRGVRRFLFFLRGRGQGPRLPGAPRTDPGVRHYRTFRGQCAGEYAIRRPPSPKRAAQGR